MSAPQVFKRYPAIRCWIKHILEGKYSSKEKLILTIFGKMKRVRVIVTIIEKSEKLSDKDNDATEDAENINLVFNLDDGTGVIRANLWGINPEKYDDIKAGDIVDVVGLIREWSGFISISPEIIRKVDDPNFILLRNAEIIKKIKTEDLHEIPENLDDEPSDADFTDEVDIDDLFNEEDPIKNGDNKEELYSLIEHHSNEGSGINFEEIKKVVQISDDELKAFLRDLEMESRIYQSEENNYQTY